MFIVGLTGGIASGKSTVAAEFQQLGVPVVDADEVARAVVEPGEPALAKLIETFGETILNDDGRLNRERMRQIAFADPAQRRKLDAIMHPAIGMRMQKAIAAAKGPYLILMVPLLVETGQHRLVGRVLVVDVPEAIQIQRLMARDGSDRTQADAILSAQASRQQRLAAAHDIIHNDGDMASIKASVAILHAAYLLMVNDKSAQNIRLILPERPTTSPS